MMYRIQFNSFEVIAILYYYGYNAQHVCGLRARLQKTFRVTSSLFYLSSGLGTQTDTSVKGVK